MKRFFAFISLNLMMNDLKCLSKYGAGDCQPLQQPDFQDSNRFFGGIASIKRSTTIGSALISRFCHEIKRDKYQKVAFIPDECGFYPWGNDFLADNVVYSNNSGGQTAAVGSKPGGKSWIGGYDQSGNVWEWVNSVLMYYPYNPNDGREADGDSDNVNSRVLRGGSLKNGPELVRATYRTWVTPTYSESHFGFRCARTYDI